MDEEKIPTCSNSALDNYLEFYGTLQMFFCKRHNQLYTKAELLQVGIFFPHPFICMRNFITKIVGNRRN